MKFSTDSRKPSAANETEFVDGDEVGVDPASAATNDWQPVPVAWQTYLINEVSLRRGRRHGCDRRVREEQLKIREKCLNALRTGTELKPEDIEPHRRRIHAHLRVDLLALRRRVAAVRQSPHRRGPEVALANQASSAKHRRAPRTHPTVSRSSSGARNSSDPDGGEPPSHPAERRVCPCGCGREISRRKTWFEDACRKRYERRDKRRPDRYVTEPPTAHELTKRRPRALAEAREQARRPDSGPYADLMRIEGLRHNSSLPDGDLDALRASLATSTNGSAGHRERALRAIAMARAKASGGFLSEAPLGGAFGAIAETKRRGDR